MILVKHVFEDVAPIVAAKEEAVNSTLGKSTRKNEMEAVEPSKGPNKKYIGTVIASLNKGDSGDVFGRTLYLNKAGYPQNLGAGGYVPKDVLTTACELVNELNNKDFRPPLTGLKAFDFNDFILTYEVLNNSGDLGIAITAYSVEDGMIATIHEHLTIKEFEYLRTLTANYYNKVESDVHFYFLSNIRDGLKITPNQSRSFKPSPVSRSSFMTNHCLLLDQAETERFLYELNIDIRLAFGPNFFI